MTIIHIRPWYLPQKVKEWFEEQDIIYGEITEKQLEGRDIMPFCDVYHIRSWKGLNKLSNIMLHFIHEDHATLFALFHTDLIIW